MNWKKFLNESARTDHPHLHMDMPAEFYHSIMGMSTETGELLDIVKKNMFYRKPIDYAHVKEELGDVMWYIAQLCRILNLNLEEILQENIDKLRIRYPEQFTVEDALNRKDKQ